MNLQNLVEWANKEKDLKSLRIKIRKEGDINICSNLLGEIVKRIQNINDLNKKSKAHEEAIQTFLMELKKRGVQLEVPEEKKPEPEKSDVNAFVEKKIYERDLPKNRT